MNCYHNHRVPSSEKTILLFHCISFHHQLQSVPELPQFLSTFLYIQNLKNIMNLNFFPNHSKHQYFALKSSVYPRLQLQQPESVHVRLSDNNLRLLFDNPFQQLQKQQSLLKLLQCNHLKHLENNAGKHKLNLLDVKNPLNQNHFDLK